MSDWGADDKVVDWGSGDKVVGQDGRPFGQLNRGIARGLAFPLDILTGTMNLGMQAGEKAREFSGMEPSDVEPFQMPSETLMRGMKAVGLPVAGDEPEGVLGHIERAVGETAGGAAPVAGIARALQSTGTPAVRAGAEAITRGLTERPLTTAAAEGAAATGAGAGGYVAKEAFPDSPIAEALGELGGGLSVASLPAMATRTTVGTALRGAKAATAPFTRAGGQVRAERRVQDLARDPEAAARAVQEGTIGDLSPAQASGEPGLMALERAVLETDMKLEGEFAERTAGSLQRLREEILSAGDGGDIAATREVVGRRREGTIGRLEGEQEGRLATIEQEREAAQAALENRRSRTLGALDARLKQTQASAEQRLSQIRPEMRDQAASVIVRDEIEKALRDARAQERQLWQAVPEDVTVSTENARAAYEALWNDLPRAQRDNMPEIARRFLRPPKTNEAGEVIDKGGMLGEENSVKELQGLRSALLEEARKARAAGEYNKARIIEGNETTVGLGEALLDDMASGAAPEIDTAREFSAALNQTFNRGAVGRVLSSAREGGAKIAPELTLESAVRRGAPGDVAVREISQAIEQSPEAGAQAIQEFLKNKFAAYASRDGKLNAARAKQFIRDYGDVLNRFPALKRQMSDAEEAQALLDTTATTVTEETKRVGIEVRNLARQVDQLAQKASRTVEKRYSDRVKRLQNPKVSYTAEFLNAPVDQEIQKMIRSRNPTMAAREIKKQAAKDLSGEALKGLKAGVVDQVLNKAASGSFTPDGTNILSGNALRSVLRDKATRRVLTEIMTPAEVTRLDRIANELQKLEMARGGLPKVGRVMADMPGTILDYIVRTGAARLGARAGHGTSGASLLTAHFASRRAKEFLGKITNDKAAELIKDAIQDPQLFAALLTRTSAPTMVRKRAFDRLNAWLVGPGSRLLEGEEENDER